MNNLTLLSFVYNVVGVFFIEIGRVSLKSKEEMLYFTNNPELHLSNVTTPSLIKSGLLLRIF